MERRILILRIAMTMALGTCMFLGASAQEYVATPVTISKDKVKIDGKVFYSHIVMERQTLYSISKAYYVSTDEIIRYNPSIKENGLRKNDIIIIPVVDIPAAEAQQIEEVPQQVAEETQPQTQALVQTQTLVQTHREEDTEKRSEVLKHTVKWYEDLGLIATKYGVTEEAIMKANGLKDHKIRNRQVLIIPAQVVHAEITEPEVEVAAADTDVEEDNISDFLANLWKTPVNATLILPFKATGTTSSRNHMDFYSGVLLAAKEMKDNGINLHLNVYDIAPGISEIPSYYLKRSDLIIGPASYEDIAKVIDIVGSNCPVISPLDQKAEKLTAQYDNLIQAPSSQYAQYADIAKWIKEDRQAGDKVIVISEKGAKANDAGRDFRAIIDSNAVHYTPFAYSILEGREIQKRIEGVMTADGVNRVVIASENEAFVNDAVRNLNLIVHNKFQIVLYAPAKIRSFDTIEVDNFHNTSLHASLTYNIDYEDSNVKDFIRKYRAMFHSEPTQYAYQGYDIAKYFIGLASKYQKGWTSHLEKEDAQMLQNCFQFRSNGDGGYINKGIRRIIYGKDYQIEEVL